MIPQIERTHRREQRKEQLKQLMIKTTSSAEYNRLLRENDTLEMADRLKDIHHYITMIEAHEPQETVETNIKFRRIAGGINDSIVELQKLIKYLYYI